MKTPLRTSSFIKLIPLASVLLTACTLTGTGEQSGASPLWQSHEQQVKALTQYQTRGAFAYLTDSQKLYARFFWQQQTPEQYRLVLTNPLGNTVMELNVQPGMVQLVDDKGQRYVSDNAEKMIFELTGMTIPLENMRQWMIGLPADAKDLTFTPEGQLKKITLDQNGQRWTVEYRNYDTKAQPALPGLIEISHGDERIKLKMDDWTRQ
ncbi:outer-membrane lipoprotein LolB [Leminorella grimontii]|uniref:Outer-membrane lipoprotein LolB n=1 Tax=Leminorella grimontii TaxID=82981 RepID=A0AAV5N1I1_9GAMM|nr:lipoprotein insertase outer membrane protein LolB [Leminorella grimontii]KFC95937.1 outer membrane lipoprotein [Leminorella grimontii ATCC 33999 = DSM 5078]GKX54884.1 outer-membrane lipoprotein LolB [Leminorella grimontii]GKX58302.1 outer-membrane lipoprotein LolB [Leminorella grimontii]VFS58218.1 Outer-membrane lipoprotein lolB precursor [Leminorella grimontii]